MTSSQCHRSVAYEGERMNDLLPDDLLHESNITIVFLPGKVIYTDVKE